MKEWETTRIYIYEYMYNREHRLGKISAYIIYVTSLLQ